MTFCGPDRRPVSNFTCFVSEEFERNMQAWDC